MANTYKNTKTLNPALRSIGNVNVRGVVKGGQSAQDKAERAGLPALVSETGYIDPSLILGGSPGGTTEERVREIFKDGLTPYENGQEIKDEIDTKANTADLPNIIKNQVTEQIQQGGEIKTEINNVIDGKLSPYTNGQEIKDEIDTKISANTAETMIADKLQPYADGQEIKDEVSSKVPTLEYQQDFSTFDTEAGATKGDKIKNYIDAHGGSPDAILQADMTPYGQTTKATTGAEIQNALNEKVATDDYNADFATFDNEIGNTLGEKIRSAMVAESTGITEDKLSECLSPYSASTADITEIGEKIKADTDAKVATTDFDAEFANFDAQTGATKGAKIQSYIDTHTPTNSIIQSDMSPYGATDKTKTGEEIAAAIEAAAGGGYTEEQIKGFAEQQISVDLQTGGTIDNAVNTKLTDTLTKTDLSPYGQTDKTQTGTEIQNALNLKADKTEAILVSDMSPYGQNGKNLTGAEIEQAISDAISEGLEPDGEIDVSINVKSNAISKQIFSASMSPYSSGTGDIGGVGQRIKDDVNLKLNTSALLPFADGQGIQDEIDTRVPSIEYNDDFDNFSAQTGDTKGLKIQSYIDANLANKVSVNAMSPYNTDPDKIGLAIQTAIEAGGGGMSETTFQQFMSPYGATTPGTTGTEIQAAIASAGKTDDQIKALAEQQITTDLADGGTIKTAVVMPSDLGDYYTDDKTAIGTNIKNAIAAVDGKTKTETQIEDLAKSVAVEPTDMGEYFTDDKTQIGANIKAAIMAGGDPQDPVLKQSDLAPYGATDKTQTGADIEAAIDQKVLDAFQPYVDGQDIYEDQVAQTNALTSKINNVSDSIVPTIKNSFGANNFAVTDNLTNSTYIGFSAADVQFENPSFFHKATNSIYYWDISLVSGRVSFVKYDIATKQNTILKSSAGEASFGYAGILSAFIRQCIDDPNIVIAVCIWGNYANGIMSAFSTDGGANWTFSTASETLGPGYSISLSTQVFKDAAGNLFAFFGSFSGTAKGGCNLVKFQITDTTKHVVEEVANDTGRSTIASNYSPILYNTGDKEIFITAYYYEEKNYETLKARSGTGNYFQNPDQRIYITLKGDNGYELPNQYLLNYAHRYNQCACLDNAILMLGSIADYGGSYYSNWLICKDITVDCRDPSTPLIFEPFRPAGDTLGGVSIQKYNYTSSYDPYANRLLFKNNNKIYGFLVLSDTYQNKIVPVVFDLETLKISDWDVQISVPYEISRYYYPVSGFGLQYQTYFSDNLPITLFCKNTDNQYWTLTTIEVESTELDSFKVGDVLVTCRNPGANWLECDGSTFTATDYPLLAKLITDYTLPTGTPSFLTGGTATYKVYIKAK